jgi:hypothetical protein
MQIFSKKFVIRKSFEVHLFPSGCEAEIDHPSNMILWEAESKEFKLNYLPPQANEIMKLKAISDKYDKMELKKFDKQAELMSRAVLEYELEVGQLDIFSLGVALYHLLVLKYPFA